MQHIRPCNSEGHVGTNLLILAVKILERLAIIT